MTEAAEVLRGLVRPKKVMIHSSSKLQERVDSAIAHDDRDRKKKKRDPLRRKPKLTYVTGVENSSSAVSVWEVLHVLGRAIGLSRRGAMRGLAEHWGSLKYTQALAGGCEQGVTSLVLSEEGRERASGNYKRIQSEEIGTGLALLLVERALRESHQEHLVSIVPAETALHAGWTLSRKGKGYPPRPPYRPSYFAEVWRPGEVSRVVPIVCRGNHNNKADTSIRQLASASAHAETVHIGDRGKTPCLLLSTQLPKKDTVTVHVLGASGEGRLPNITEADLDGPLRQGNFSAGIVLSGRSHEKELPGIHIDQEKGAWFQRSLARTSAAGLMAFSAGDTAQYLTERQGKKYFSEWWHPATGGAEAQEEHFFGTPFIGTDHVFRLNGTRVEAYSGVAKDLFHLLDCGELGKYRNALWERRDHWPEGSWDEKWQGPVSVRPDGSVLALRILP